MRNVHLITKEQEGADVLHQYLYITSEEAIKEGDWHFKNDKMVTKSHIIDDTCKKIILTDNPDLIAEGVQPIGDEFLEWFVKNPSCESVEVRDIKTIPALQLTGNNHLCYKIIIPQEEPKQIKCYCGHTITCDCGSLEETLELPKEIDFANEIEQISEYDKGRWYGRIEGAKWQAERMYSEEDIKLAFEAGHKKGFSGYPNTENWKELPFKEWFEQFKKKQNEKDFN